MNFEYITLAAACNDVFTLIFLELQGLVLRLKSKSSFRCIFLGGEQGELSTERATFECNLFLYHSLNKKSIASSFCFRFSVEKNLDFVQKQEIHLKEF